MCAAKRGTPRKKKARLVILGENLRRKRLEAGLTQKQLGQLVGVKPQAISNYERVEMIGVLPATAARYAAVLRCAVTELTKIIEEKVA